MTNQTKEIIYDRFKRDTESHSMLVENDNGVHRSLYFSEKGNAAYHFRIITWPGHLAISGDMGDFVFARTPDMFDFFRSKEGEINIGYWAEKLTADSVFGGGYEEFCWDSFLSDFKESLIRQNDTINEQEVLNYIDGAISCIEHDEHGAIQLVRDWGGGCAWDCGEITLEPYLISLGKKVTSRFIWCLHAIVWAINQYDDYKLENKGLNTDTLCAGLYAIKYKDNYDGQGDTYFMLANKNTNGAWTHHESGQELLDYAGDEILSATFIEGLKDECN